MNVNKKINMELTAEQIQSNWNMLMGYINTYISSPRKEKLLDFYKKYEERIAIMPASLKPQYHSCTPGGYVHHVLNVVRGALKLDKVWKEEGVENNYTTEELVFSAINHDLGKMGDQDNEAYLPSTDQWRKEKLGEMYQFNTKLPFMSVPDRSLHLLTQHGIDYSVNEFLAIKLHDGVYDDANKPYLCTYSPETKPRTSLIHILHHADLMASRIEFEKEWFPKFYNPKPEIKITKNDRVNKEIKRTVESVGNNEALKNVVSKFFEK